MLVFREVAGSNGAIIDDGKGDAQSDTTTRQRGSSLNVSVPTPLGWYFFSISMGRERRSLDRLVNDGQFSLAKLSLFYTLAMWALIGLIGLGVMVGLYMLKSMAGINLMDGSSFLHDFMWPPRGT